MTKRTLLSIILIFSIFLLCSCTPNFKLVDGKLIDKKNGITYLSAPIYYEPSSTELEPYAKCSALKIELYPITGQAPTEWISELYGIGGVWYADTITLPTLREFAPETLHICVEETIVTGIGIVTEKADIDSIIDAFLDGEPGDIVTSGESFKLKFESSKYPGIFYNLLYVKGDDGENYIYDRSTKTCVNVGDVLTKYLP